MNNITSESYSLIDNVELSSSAALYSVKIKTKSYKDVIVTFGKVSLAVQDDGETAKLSFKYQIDDAAKFSRTDLENDRNFNTYLGDLLSYIIQSAFDSENYTIGNPKISGDNLDVNSTTNDNTSKTD